MGTSRAWRLLGLSLVTAACSTCGGRAAAPTTGPGAPTTTAPGTASRAGVAPAPSGSLRGALSTELEALRERVLQAQADGGYGPVRDLPAWFPSGKGPEAPRTGLGAALGHARTIMTQGGEGWLRAYAALWLSAHGGADELDRIAALLDDRGPAGPIPDVYVPQAAMQIPTVKWHRASVAWFAATAVERLTGVRVASRADYLRWRRDYPDLHATSVVWIQRLRRELGPNDTTVDVPALEVSLAELRQSPELLARVLILGNRWGNPFTRSRGFPMSEEHLVRFVKERIGPNRLVALVRREVEWPEFRDPQSGDSPYWHFVKWVAKGAEELFDEAAHGPAFLQLWEQRLAKDGVSTSLALAAARLNSRHSLQVLRTSVERSDDVFTRTKLWEELIGRHRPPAWPFVRTWFWRQWGQDAHSHPNDAATILGALGDAGKPAAGQLAELVRDRRFDRAGVQEASAVVRAVRVLEPSAAFPMSGDLKLLWGKSMRGLPAEDPERQKAEARVRAAVADCVARARRHLAGRRTRASDRRAP